MNDVFREIIDLIRDFFDVARRLQRDSARYLTAAITIRRLVTNFMREHQVPGLSLAIAYKGRLVFSKGYGVANRVLNDPVRTDHLFRIASLSKSITAVAIFKLVEERRPAMQIGEGWRPVLQLDERVFGQGNILGNTFGVPPAGSNIDQITVQHLLEHTSGWSNNNNDIMFDLAHINDTQAALITEMVTNRPLSSG